jgi:aryl-alcohol dehydrogenase-like predicted oxidoreductase
MDNVILGRTGLKVTVMGIGCGGPSRVGQRYGKTEAESVGFNMLNQSARHRVFPKAAEKNIGILIMFAVRLALSRTERLAQIIQELVEKKQVDPADIDRDDPLGFLVHAGGAVSLVDAAYRFCRYEPGTHVILSGTGNPDHLEENTGSFSRPPLPQEDVLRLEHIFRRVDSVSGH